MTESKFADDVAVYATTREALEQAAGEFVNTAAKWGLTVSLEKTKLITMGKELGHEDSLPVQLAAGEIATVEDFTYLGSKISSDGEVKSEIVTRISKASRAFGCLKAAVFQNSQLSTDIKREVYRAVVLSTLLYGAETWTVKAENVRRIPQSLHQVNVGGVQNETMEREDYIKGAGRGLWNDRRHGGDFKKTPA